MFIQLRTGKSSIEPLRGGGGGGRKAYIISGLKKGRLFQIIYIQSNNGHLRAYFSGRCKDVAVLGEVFNKRISGEWIRLAGQENMAV